MEERFPLHVFRKPPIEISEPTVTADWCDCGKPNVKMLEKNHLCWCRCLNCGRESVEVWDDKFQAISNWINEKYRKSDKSCYEDHFFLDEDVGFKEFLQKFTGGEQCKQDQ